MGEQPLDVRGSLRLIRRFWRVVLALAATGLVAAAAYDLWAPPKYQATAVVLLPPSGSSNNTTSPTVNPSTATDARIATSAAVLVPAGHRADPALSLTALQQAVSTSTNAASVLEIHATGTTPHRAEALANSVADRFAAFLATTGSTTSSSIVAGLQAQTAQLDTQLSDVQKQLTLADQQLASDQATSAAHEQDAALVDRLIAEQSSLGLQVNAIKSQIAQARLGAVAATHGTEVLQRATTAVPPSMVALAFPLVIGVIAGLLLGSIGVIAWHRNDRRLWSRDALAEAVGAPVVLSLGVPRRRSLGDWVGLLVEHRPSALEQWTTRRALREISSASGGPSPLKILALASDPGAVSLVVHLAVASAMAGTRTRLSMVGDQAPSLRAACARFDDQPPRPGLVVESKPTDKAAADDDAELLITLATTSGSSGVTESASAGTVTVLAVSAGSATAEQLASAAIATADAGNPVSYVLMATSVSNDHTVGRLPTKAARTAPIPLGRPAGTKSRVSLGRAQ